jgi:hypothetical protein
MEVDKIFQWDEKKIVWELKVVSWDGLKEEEGSRREEE